jgi:hypothetical protein
LASLLQIGEYDTWEAELARRKKKARRKLARRGKNWEGPNLE